MRDDVVLQGGVAAVGLAEGGAALHLVDVEGAILALLHHVGQHQHVVVEEAGLEERHPVAFVKQLGGAGGVGVDVALEFSAEVDAVGEGGLEG